MVEEQKVPKCDCGAEDGDDYEEHTDVRWVPLTWRDGRVDLVPAPCGTMDLWLEQVQESLPEVDSIYLECEDSRSVDSITFTLGRVSDDVYLGTKTVEETTGYFYRGPLDEVTGRAFADADF